MKDGGPAFPSNHGYIPQEGMSLRDWFAGQIIAGIVANPSILEMDGNVFAKKAYILADEMMEARRAKP